MEVAAVAVEETGRLAKGVSEEREPVFSSGGGTFLDSAPLLFTVEEAVVVEEEAERLLKRVSPEPETVSLSGDAFSCVTGEAALRGGVSGGVCGGV